MKYQHQSIKVIKGREAGKIAELTGRGWELTAQHSGPLRTELTFRKAQPESFPSKVLAAFQALAPATRRKVLIATGGLAAALVMIIVILAVVSGGEDNEDLVASDENTEVADPEPSASPTTPPETPQESATPTPPSPEPSEAETSEAPPNEPEPSKAVTQAEVVKAFQSFVDERAAAGVVISQAVTEVSFNNRVVRVTFDPAAVDMDQSMFDQINPYNNPYDQSESLADFVATVISFNDDIGLRLRPKIDAIEAVRPDGSLIGDRTTAEIIRLNRLGS